MKTRIHPLRRLWAALLAFALAFGLNYVAYAADEHPAKDKASGDTIVSAEAIAAYPLTTCVVSGEKLGEMGKPIDYIYKEEGKPDRLVRFCCKMCISKFKKDPAKYLKLIDEAAAKAK